MPLTGLKTLPNLRKMWIGTGGRDLDDTAQDDAHLGADLALRRNPSRRTFLNQLHIKNIREHITRLPEAGETIHGVVSGRYPLWAFIPAILDMTGQTISDLQLMTLSFATDNGTELIDLLDAGKIQRVQLGVSHYFQHTNKLIYDPIAAALQERGQQIRGLRTHAKIINAQLAGGATYTVEASANLRSSRNIEQFTLTADAQLYAFHRDWIGQIFSAKTLRDRL